MVSKQKQSFTLLTNFGAGPRISQAALPQDLSPEFSVNWWLGLELAQRILYLHAWGLGCEDSNRLGLDGWVCSGTSLFECGLSTKQPQGAFLCWLKAPCKSIPKGTIRSCMVFSNPAFEITLSLLSHSICLGTPKSLPPPTSFKGWEHRLPLFIGGESKDCGLVLKPSQEAK